MEAWWQSAPRIAARVPVQMSTQGRCLSSFLTRHHFSHYNSKLIDLKCSVQSVPVSGWADVDFPWYTAGLKFVRQGDIVSKKTVTGHFNSNDSSKNRPRVQSNSHLQAKKYFGKALSTCQCCLNGLSKLLGQSLSPHQFLLPPNLKPTSLYSSQLIKNGQCIISHTS